MSRYDISKETTNHTIMNNKTQIVRATIDHSSSHLGSGLRKAGIGVLLASKDFGII